MKKILGLILALAVASTLFGCAAKPAAETPKEEAAPATEAAAPAAEEVEEAVEEAVEEVVEEASAKKDIKIGYSLPNVDAVFFEAEYAEVERLRDELGIDIVLTVADGDADKQNAQIEDFITMGCDAICCVCCDSNSIMSSVEACKDAGVPYIAVGRKPADLTDVSFLIRGTPIEAGRMAADLIKDRGEKIGKTDLKVIEMIGNLGDTAAVDRRAGFEEKAEEYGFDIVGEVMTEWDADLAYSRFNDLVATGVEFDAVYLPSDILITGTLSVLEQAGLFHPVGEEGHIIVTGTDGDPTEVQAILDRKIDGGISQDAFEIARLGVEAAVQFAEGNPPEGKEKVMGYQMLTTDNIDQLVADNAIWGAQGLNK